MMSSLATSSPVSASTLAYLMRWPVLRMIWLNETFSVSEVAGYRATGQVTSERRKKPFQLARGAMGKLRQTQQTKGPEYHQEAPFQTWSAREFANGVNCHRSAARGPRPTTSRATRAAELGGAETPEHHRPSGVGFGQVVSRQQLALQALAE